MEFELEFEKPIKELEKKLEEMRRVAQENNVDVSIAVEALETKLMDLRKSIYSNLSRWQRVQLSRHPQRPYTSDYIYNIAEDFAELHGDRNSMDDKAMVGGFAKLGDFKVLFVGQQKGRTTKLRQYRNFGMASPQGYRKALRLMKLAEKFNRPVICLIDTPGAYPGLKAEEHGQAEAIARNLREMPMLRVPVICVVIGEGASGGALGIGVGDRVYMMENTWYSVISPESCSSILWRDWAHKEQAAESLKLTAQDNLAFGIIDEVIPEPLGGAHNAPLAAYENVKNVLLRDLDALTKMDPEARIEARFERLSKIGVVHEASAPLE